MKGPWRKLMLFFLPGMFLGALVYDCFYRVQNLLDDVLLGWSIVGIALLGCAAAVAAAAIDRPRPGPRYYQSCFILLCAWSLGMFLTDLLQLDNLQVLLWQVPLVGGAAGAAASALAGSSDYSKRDRFRWGLGCAAFAGVVLLAFPLHIGHAIPAGTGFLCLLLTAGFLAGSPLTRRGTWKKRLLHGAILLAALVLKLAAPPLYLPLPDHLDEKERPPRRWNGTAYTADGWRTLWHDPKGVSGFYTNYDRLTAQWGEDAEYRSAVPGALAAMAHGPRGWVGLRVLCVAGPGSVMPGYFSETGLSDFVRSWKQPEALAGVKFPDLPQCDDHRPDFQESDPDKKTTFDIIALMTLPSGQYPERLGRFCSDLCTLLEPDGVLIVPEFLITRARLLQYLDKELPFHGILPGPARVRVFSHRPLQLSPAKLDENLDQYFGDTSPLPRGTFEVLYGNYLGAPLPDKPFEPERIVLGQAFDAPLVPVWLLWSFPVLLVLLWQFVRLFLERRGNGYCRCNHLENGFVCVSMLALTVAALRMRSDTNGVECFVPVLLAALVVAPFRRGGFVWLNLIGILGWGHALKSSHILLYLILAQAVLCAGNLIRQGDAPPRERRIRLALWLLGGCFAILPAAALLAAGGWVGLLWLAVLAARIPGIWQNRSRRAILSGNGRS